MKIIALEAENIKKLKAVAIRPDGNFVQITGENGNGKTSVLDAIWWAITGARNIQAEPIRVGEERARIMLDTGELVITRTFKRKEEGGFSTAVKVESEAGQRFESPQAVLDELAGALAFDPLEFTRMKPADQFDTLKSFVSGIDFAEIEKSNNQDFDARTIANRRAKETRAQADGIKLPPGAVPEKVDIAVLETKLAEAADHNAKVAQSQARRESAVQQIEQAKARAAQLRIEAENVDAHAKKLQEDLDAAQPLPALTDASKVRADLDAARTGNAIAEQAARKAELTAEAAKHEDEAERLTKAIAARNDEKEKAIAAAEMPVKGLGFSPDGGVTLCGVPFNQASDAEQLKASIAIAASLNPTLRIARVRDGSLLDVNARAALAEFADAHDVQVWIEIVDTSGKVGFVMEDGYIKGAPRPAPEVEESV